MKKRIFILLLSALLCASALTGCGGGETADETTSQTAAAETEAETEFRYTADYLPDVTYDGYAYRVIAFEENPAHVDEPSGDIIDDAIYQRNILLEEQYDITFEQTLYLYTDYTKVADFMRNAGRAQSDDTDLAYMSFRDTYNLVLEGFVPTASSLPVIDLSQPWYMQSLNDSLTIDGITLMAYSAMDTNPGGSCVYFNKQLIENLNLDDPYELVKDGTWTIEKNYQMAEAAISDLNGDGQMTVDDRFGYITEWDRISLVAYYGTGNLLVDVIDGVPVASQKEVLFDAFQLCHSYCQMTGFMLDTFKQFGTAESSRIAGSELFKQGNSLFICNGTRLLPTMGDMEDDYGIVPLPKWSADQDRYYSMQDGYGISAALACSTDLERVCVIKEAMAAESLNIVRPAYYENALKNRYVRDETSVEMLEIITSSVVADLGQSPWWDIVRAPWQDTLQKPSPDFASAVTKNLPKCEKAINDLMDMIADLKAQEQ
ncbi:MAG: hypothetical protein IJB52_11160 [Clostridia bacterium]|nr:hypothetical protein [Clostridia bacterium]